jgi:hypothetical protein
MELLIVVTFAYAKSATIIPAGANDGATGLIPILPWLDRVTPTLTSEQIPVVRDYYIEEVQSPRRVGEPAWAYSAAGDRSLRGQ